MEAEPKFVRVHINDGPKKLLARYLNANKWDTPAGRVEDGEELNVAAARELLERTGYTIDPTTLTGGELDQEGFYNFHGDAQNAKQTQIATREGGDGGEYAKWAETTHSHDKTLPDGSTIDVFKLMELVKSLQSAEVPISEITDWNASKRTGFSEKRLAKADLSYPIIIDENKAHLDGRHRLVKAHRQGDESIQAITAPQSLIEQSKIAHNQKMRPTIMFDKKAGGILPALAGGAGIAGGVGMAHELGKAFDYNTPEKAISTAAGGVGGLYLVEKILQAMGKKTGLMGTLGATKIPLMAAVGGEIAPAALATLRSAKKSLDTPPVAPPSLSGLEKSLLYGGGAALGGASMVALKNISDAAKRISDGRSIRVSTSLRKRPNQTSDLNIKVQNAGDAPTEQAAPEEKPSFFQRMTGRQSDEE